jgi:hypothetical protein
MFFQYLNKWYKKQKNNKSDWMSYVDVMMK